MKRFWSRAYKQEVIEKNRKLEEEVANLRKTMGPPQSEGREANGETSQNGENQKLVADRDRALSELQDVRTHSQETTKQLTSELEAASAKIDELETRLSTSEKPPGAANDAACETRTLRRNAHEFGYRIWQKETHPNAVPPFRQRVASPRQSPAIIAVANWNHGVGKTVITANLAATMQRKGRRVLLVDLDPMATLTRYCLPAERIGILQKTGRLVDELFVPDVQHADECLQQAEFLGDHGHLRLLPSDIGLATAEVQAMANWLTTDSNEDIRFRLRCAIHVDEIQDEYDIILLDCPPGPSTAFVNALAASDFVLIPDTPAAEEEPRENSVPALIDWVRRLAKIGVCPDLQILGFLANKAQDGTALSEKQQTAWNVLMDNCRNASEHRPPGFVTNIPNHPGLRSSAQGLLYGDDDVLHAAFCELFDEIEARVRLNGEHEVERIEPMRPVVTADFQQADDEARFAD